MNWKLALLAIVIGTGCLDSKCPAADAPAGLPNPFYAMDTATRGLGTPEVQLDTVKELGYSGICWTECDPQQARQVADEAQKRGLKMFTIYCAATANKDGLKPSARIKPVIEALKGTDTMIWLHIGGGKDVDVATLKGDEPVIKDLRELADFAAANSAKIAIYPHVGEWTAKVKDAIKIAKTVDRKNFGITFNLCHCLAMGDEANVESLLEEAKPILFTVTINGADSGVSGGKWDRLIQTLDKGTYDVKIVLRKLKAIGFTGPIGFQGYAIKGDKKENLTRTIEAWKKLSAL